MAKNSKTEIPRELNQAIIWTQAAEYLDWIEAAAEAAVLVDAYSEKYKESVKKETEKTAKIRFMKQLNKARVTIMETSYLWGLERGEK